jgi:hypothetical protein
LTGGIGPTCTVTIGGEDKQVTAFFEYWDCGTTPDGNIIASTGDSPPGACTKVSP